MRSLPAVVLCGALLAAQFPVAAQVSLTSTGGRSVARNELPVDVFLHVYSPSAKSFSTLRVPAGGEALVQFADARKLSEELLTTTLSRRSVFRACTVGQPGRESLVQLAREVKDLDFLETDGGRARVDAASASARLDLDQYYDEQNTFRNDPLRLELRRQQERDLPMGLIQRQVQQEAIQSIASDVTHLALAWADVQRERLNVLHDQFRTFEPLVNQARLALEIREKEYEDYRQTVLAWRNFSETVSRALDASSAKGDEHPIASAKVSKVCVGPSGAWDSFQIDGPERSGHSVLIAEVSFDKGEKQLTYLRRIGTTSQWTGRLDWPEPGSSAAVRVRWPGTMKWYSVSGRVDVQRPSMKSSLEDARRAASAIEKNLRETNFRAAGGDVIKTAPTF